MRIALLPFLVPALCLAQGQGNPRLVFEAPDFDFGQVAPAAVVKHAFRVTNAGDAPLTISRLVPGCGCTSALAGKETLAPGESTALEVTFNTAGESGGIRKSVRVFSDDPIEPVQAVYFEAKVLPEVHASAEAVLFQDLTRADRPKASVKLTSGTGRPIRVDGPPRPGTPWLGVAFREDGNDLWVDFDLLADRLPKDKLQGTGTIALRLLNPGPSEVNLGVRWELRSAVTASPARVAWAEPAGRALHAAVHLEHREHLAFRVLRVRTTSPLLHAALASSRSAPLQTIQLTLSAQARPGDYEEKLVLVLDTPGHPELEVRVSAALR